MFALAAPCWSASGREKRKAILDDRLSKLSVFVRHDVGSVEQP